MRAIKFGTDGWRGIIAKDFTSESLSKVAMAISLYLLRKYKEPSVIIGHDTRFSGKFFMETVAKVLAAKGVKVYCATNFVTSPMISLGVMKLKANMGIVITASHNSAEYNGIKIKGEYGGPMIEPDIKMIEDLMLQAFDIDIDMLNLQMYINVGVVQYIDVETMYIDHVKRYFDLDLLKKEALVSFDAMYGSAQGVFKRLFPEMSLLHCELDPTFRNIAPEPIEANLNDLKEAIAKNSGLTFGVAVDGDGDRLALVDHSGVYYDSHKLVLLLIHYLAGYKNFSGKVVVGFSISSKVEKLCNHYGLAVERVRIGFKEITRIMLSDDVLLGAEESGGIGLASHLPERDALWCALVFWQWMVEYQKPLSVLMDEVYSITGNFHCERVDLEITSEQRFKIFENCRNDSYTAFGDNKIVEVQTLDGFKYFFENGDWFLLRSSGTEPVLRIYAETTSKEKTLQLLEIGIETIMKSTV